MKIEVVCKVDEVKYEEIKQKTVIVIDVLRASSTIAAALAHGASEVIPVETIGQARMYKGEEFLLAGERYGKRVSGFPLTNSPTEMTNTPLHGHSLVLTTTNGTRAIHKSWKADAILIGSFLNGLACAQMAHQMRKDVTILCAGSRQQFALEDGLCAGYLVSLLQQQVPGVIINDFGLAMLASYHGYKHDLIQVLRTTATGKRLVQAGNEEDIDFCAQQNLYSFVPTVRNESIIVQYPEK